MIFKIFPLEKPLIFGWFFHHFFVFFRSPCRTAFLEGPGADLCRKVRFWRRFGLPVGPEIDPWSDIFCQKGSKSRVPRTRGSVLEPTFFGHRFFNAFWSLFGSIWGHFGLRDGLKLVFGGIGNLAQIGGGTILVTWERILFRKFNGL